VPAFCPLVYCTYYAILDGDIYDIFTLIFLCIGSICLLPVAKYFSTGFTVIELNEPIIQSKIFGKQCKKIDLRTVKYVYVLFTPVGYLGYRLFLFFANEKVMTKNVFEMNAPMLLFNARHYVPIRIQNKNFERIKKVLSDIGIDNFEEHDYELFKNTIRKNGFMFYRNDGIWKSCKTIGMTLYCEDDKKTE
jgi:hypothetical protein